jgi:hypothetical protein
VTNIVVAVWTPTFTIFCAQPLGNANWVEKMHTGQDYYGIAGSKAEQVYCAKGIADIQNI